MHSEIAVVSITRRPRSSTSRYPTRFEELGLRVLDRIGGVDTVDLGRLEQDLGLDLHRPQRRGAVGGEVRVAGPAARITRAPSRGAAARGGG